MLYKRAHFKFVIGVSNRSRDDITDEAGKYQKGYEIFIDLFTNDCVTQ